MIAKLGQGWTFAAPSVVAPSRTVSKTDTNGGTHLSRTASKTRSIEGAALATPVVVDLVNLQNQADVNYGEMAAHALEVASGHPISDGLAALLEEEGRLQRLLSAQALQFQEVQARIQQANTPDPQLGTYTESLRDSVNAEVRAKEAGDAAEAARASLEVAQQALQRETEVQRAQEVRLFNAGTQAQQLMRANAALRNGVHAAETRLAQARTDHAHQSAAYRAGVAELQQGARSAESNLTALEVEVSRLEAEVRWYRLRCGEDVPVVAPTMRSSELG
mmetsp:Transcript_105943/g.274132  ORF Transcript_105943/g.274132 Transcript_105943/m.274132 type:complete len:277 (+) Transcript_105943:91-921(+)|eukprot:CAMPEP_0115176960 /NCGR_PEP_ID=MMETSP0270-20121206/5136_1 /TAXON_ID=71861 /ORGANISM="Scrippsiella trochoidea, Strain CCMP3099" /LENGTH=276 /DNA_ID=CAMNT_0002589871 /DNA_START=29 /DNA_END=859 /DNA_ORIENTATION=+